MLNRTDIIKIVKEHLLLLPEQTEETVNKLIDEIMPQLKASQLEAQVGEILADFENLLIEIMSNRKCSIGSIDNYYDLHLEVKKINELYSKLQYYHIVSQKSR